MSAFSTAGLQAKVAKWTQAAQKAAGVSVIDLMNPVMRQILDKTPTDTNRLKRGYAMAANDATLGPFSVPKIQPSKYRGQLNDRFAIQIIRFENMVTFWERLIYNRYTSKNRHDKWERDAERKLRVARKRLARAQQEAAKFGFTPEAIAIFRSSKNGLTITARTKMYGGVGKRVQVPGFNGVEIHNLEPHASIVESYKHAIRDAFATVSGSGLVRFKNSYLKNIGYIP